MTAKSLCAISKSAEAAPLSIRPPASPMDLVALILSPSPDPCQNAREAAKPLALPPNPDLNRLIPKIRPPLSPYSVLALGTAHG